jgi:hypothetical protein
MQKGCLICGRSKSQRGTEVSKVSFWHWHDRSQITQHHTWLSQLPSPIFAKKYSSSWRVLACPKRKRLVYRTFSSFLLTTTSCNWNIRSYRHYTHEQHWPVPLMLSHMSFTRNLIVISQSNCSYAETLVSLPEDKLDMLMKHAPRRTLIEVIFWVSLHFTLKANDL